MSYPAQFYSKTASYFHWFVAIPLIGCVGTVLKAQQAPKEEKGMWMFRHKSLGLLTGMIVAPRVAYRLFSSSAYNVASLPGSAAEHAVATLTHSGLYIFMIIMPASGIAMGYYGGKGLPFFFTTIPGATPASEEEKKKNGQIAKNTFNVHKTLGTYGKYLIPLHMAGSAVHWARGHTIFTRVNPFRSGPNL